MSSSRGSSERATLLEELWTTIFNPPQEIFGGDIQPPPITPSDFEVAEQVASVFDDIIYDETGGGNDGQVVVTQS